ncbi:MAG TPA: nucleotidyltransferase family protein [Thermoanaerobaculia bacterium]
MKFGGEKRDPARLLAVLDDAALNWIEILGYLCYHRVAGLAYETINAINVRKLDFPVFFAIYMIHQAQSMRTELQKQYVKSISSALRDADIEHVFLKGAVLSSTIYPSGSRAFNDIDLLVSKRSLRPVRDLLYGLGFRQGKYDYKKNAVVEFQQDALTESIDTRGEMAPFVKIVNDKTLKTIDVDVNFSLDWRPAGTDEAVDHFLNERILTPVDEECSIYSLREEHLFIQLCSHFYKDAALLDLVRKRKVLDLYKFVDIYTFVQDCFGGIDQTKLFDDSVKYGFDSHVFFTLNHAGTVFPDMMALPSVSALYQKYEHVGAAVLTEVFDQYDSTIRMEATAGLLDRLFSYDIIKSYDSVGSS